MNSFINPYVEICLSKAIEEISSLGKSQKLTCGSDIDDLPVMQKYSSSVVEESELCSNPAKYLCNKSINPNIVEDENARDLFDQIERDAERDQRVQDFISEKLGRQAEHCFKLDFRDYVDCTKLRNQIMSDKIYTDDRKKKAQDLFIKAKKSIITVLERRAKSLEAMGLQEAKSNLEKMINVINETQLFFGAYGSDRNGYNLSYNAGAKGRMHESQEKWYHLFTSGNFKNTIFLEGLILQADSNPQGLYFTLLHEFSHFIDPGELRGGDEYTGNPFQRELKCLKRDDSAGAKTGDPDCFEAIAKKFEDKDPSFSRQARETAKNVRENPDTSWGCPHFPDGETRCQMGQLGEAFADWMATEAFVGEQQLPSAESKTGLYQRNNERVIDLQERIAEIPNVSEQVASYCKGYHLDQRIGWNKDEQRGAHPMDEDRLNGILLAHPLIKFSLGCTPENVNNLRNLGAPVSSEKRVYCGGHLYLPFGGRK